MILEKYKKVPTNWNALIRGFDSKTLFHETAWHDHILSIHKNSEMIYFSIHDEGKIIGYFCGLMVRKFMFKALGSSLSGTGTNYMGPVINFNVNQEKLIKSIEVMLAQHNVAYFELCNDILDRDVLKRNGFSFSDGKTHKVNISSDEDNAFKSLKSTGRNRVRKGIKNGLITEITTKPSIVDIFFHQYQEVYGKQGKTTPFGIERVKSLYECLHPSGRLLTVVVKKGETVVASGLFPYDANAIYFWGAASWMKFHKLYPNELLHWEVIKFSIKNGIKEYNMCGGHSLFKNKFGGTDVSHIRFFKSRSIFVSFSKALYKKWYFLRQRLGFIFTKLFRFSF